MVRSEKKAEQRAGREVGFVGRVWNPWALGRMKERERVGKREGGRVRESEGERERERERASFREVFGRLLRSFCLADLSSRLDPPLAFLQLFCSFVVAFDSLPIALSVAFLRLVCSFSVAIQ